MHVCLCIVDVCQCASAFVRGTRKQQSEITRDRDGEGAGKGEGEGNLVSFLLPQFLFFFAAVTK